MSRSKSQNIEPFAGTREYIMLGAGHGGSPRVWHIMAKDCQTTLCCARVYSIRSVRRSEDFPLPACRNCSEADTNGWPDVPHAEELSI